MARWLLNASAANSKGPVQQKNHDSFYLNGAWMTREKMADGWQFTDSSQARHQLYAVCDGFGGEYAGDATSYQAMEALGFFQALHSLALCPFKLNKMLVSLSDRLHREAAEKGCKSGTALVGLLLQNHRVRVMHIGDDRAYLLRGGKLTRLLPKEDAPQAADSRFSLPQRYLGMPGDALAQQPSITRALPCLEGDRYLLCSRGVTSMLEDREIELLLRGAQSAESAAQILVEQALRKGGSDNATALCVIAQ